MCRYKWLLFLPLVLIAVPCFAQFGTISFVPLSGPCSTNTLGFDTTNNVVYSCGQPPNNFWKVVTFEKVQAGPLSGTCNPNSLGFDTTNNVVYSCGTAPNNTWKALGGGGTGGSGITSINGNTTPAQIIAAGSGINVNSAGGTTTISNTGMISEIIFAGTSDAVKDSTCSTTSGSPALTCTDAPFTTCPTGKTISVTAGLTSGAGEPNSLMTTISNCVSPTVAVLATNATRTSGSTTARWGTDNGPALFAQANASTTAGQSFVIPSGNYLVRTTLTSDITAQTNTSYTIGAGAHIYWIGPTGCSSNDTACPGVDSGYPLFFFPSSTTGGRDTHNVHIQLDGIIEGDNTDNNAVGIPYLNQSAVTAWVDGTSDNSSVTDITISGSGSVLNLYGFSFHGIGGSRNNVIGITHNHVAKGLNINSNNSIQNNNTFIKSHGIEAAGTNITVSNNHFDNSFGISVGGTVGGPPCTGYVINGNSFANIPTTDPAGNGTANLQLSECSVGAVISGNAFYIPTNPALSSPPTAMNIHDNTSAGDNTPTHDNLIVGNTFYANAGCYAAVFTYGTATGGNSFIGNHMTGPCLYGYVLRGYYNGTSKYDTIKNDTLIGQTADLDLGGTISNTTTLIGPIFAGTGTYFIESGTGSPIISNSWYNNSTGLHCATTTPCGLGGGGPGGGITSINADTTAAQTITGGTGISVNTAAGTTTITGTSTGSVVASPQYQVPYYSNPGSDVALTGTAGVTVDSATQSILNAAGGLTTGSTSPTNCNAAGGGCIAGGENGTYGTPSAGVCILQADSVNHTWLQSCNNQAYTPLIDSATSPLSVSGGGTVSLLTSGVTAGSYTNPTVTFDTYGRATAATSGTASSGVPNVGATFTGATSVVIPATTSGAISPNVLVQCYDTTVSPALKFMPGTVTVDQTSFQVSVTWNTARTGYCAVNNTGPAMYTASLSSNTSWTILASTHKLGAHIAAVTLTDSQNREFKPGRIVINTTGDVTITNAYAGAFTVTMTN